MCSRSDRTNLSSVFLSLGSNLGNREERLESALGLLAPRRVIVLTCSSIYRTEPLYVRNQPDFLNIVCAVETNLSARGLLSACLSVEQDLGRQRGIEKGPREIDVDILFFGQEIIETDNLVVPHPLLYERKFVLVPLAEIAPGFRDPRTGLSILQLCDQCKDESEVESVGQLRRC